MKQKAERNTLEMVSVERLVPQNHLLRKIDFAVDFTQICDFMQDLLHLTSASAAIFMFANHFISRSGEIYIGEMLVTYAAPFSG